MRLIKSKFSVGMAVLFCLLTVSASHAAIIWDSFAFRYAVDENSADIYNMNIDRFVPTSTLQGPTPQSTNAGDNTDPVDSRVDSSIPTDNSGLGLQLNAGAGGRHLSNGVRIEGYLTTSTISGGVPLPYAIGSPGSQKVFAFSNRSFHVDSNQDAKLSGLAGGAINDPEFSQPPFLRADYEWEGSIILEEIVTRQDIPQVLQSWLIGFNDMINNGPQELRVSLRTQDENGDPISYTLRTVLDLESLLLNYNFPEETQAGDIPVGALGSLGAMNSPLWIETALELPHAEFAGNPVSGRKPLQVTFTDKSTSEMTSWEWNFGDGSPISNEKNPHHTYSKVGTYTVSLTATGPLGADTETKTGYITVTRPNTGIYDLLLHSDP